MIDDDDDSASVTSDRSAFSISSEMSVTPYATSKYPNPITVRLLYLYTYNNTCSNVHVCMCVHIYVHVVSIFSHRI